MSLFIFLVVVTSSGLFNKCHCVGVVFVWGRSRLMRFNLVPLIQVHGKIGVLFYIFRMTFLFFMNVAPSPFPTAIQAVLYETFTSIYNVEVIACYFRY